MNSRSNEELGGVEIYKSGSAEQRANAESRQLKSSASKPQAAPVVLATPDRLHGALSKKIG